MVMKMTATGGRELQKKLYRKNIMRNGKEAKKVPFFIRMLLSLSKIYFVGLFQLHWWREVILFLSYAGYYIKFQAMSSV